MKASGMMDFQKDPFIHFSGWYGIIEKENKPNYNALALSTTDGSGRVSSRMVLLKDYDSHGFVFYSNYQSRKGRQLAGNPFASMLFYWPGHGRQVRIEGSVMKLSAEESDDYFNSRIPGHKINALISNQSTEIPGRQYLIDRYEKAALEYRDRPPGRPAYWGGYRLIPDLFEFWQEGENRLHDRMEYRLVDGSWLKRRLAP
jgi:pyridoxamine 5'-phosphate oxidase